MENKLSEWHKLYQKLSPENRRAIKELLRQVVINTEFRNAFEKMAQEHGMKQIK